VEFYAARQSEGDHMKNRVPLVVAATALAVAVLGVAQLGQAAQRHALTDSGDVHFAPFKDVVTLTGTIDAPTVVSQTSVLAAGNYLMSAKVIAAGQLHAFARAVCQLRYPGWSGSIADTDNSSATVGGRNAAAEDQTLSLLWAASLTSSGRVSLVCWPEELSGPAPVLTDGSLAVLPVASIGG
jgi:hypothetical protein